MESEATFEVHRRPGAKRIAIRELHWAKPIYVRPDKAEELMRGIAECLGVEPPVVPSRTPCTSKTGLANGKHGNGIVFVQCQAWAGDHAFGTHYHTTPDHVKITWPLAEGE